jgi:hypothetical protein
MAASASMSFGNPAPVATMAAPAPAASSSVRREIISSSLEVDAAQVPSDRGRMGAEMIDLIDRNVN